MSSCFVLLLLRTRPLLSSNWSRAWEHQPNIFVCIFLSMLFCSLLGETSTIFVLEDNICFVQCSHLHQWPSLHLNRQSPHLSHHLFSYIQIRSLDVVKVDVVLFTRRKLQPFLNRKSVLSSAVTCSNQDSNSHHLTNSPTFSPQNHLEQSTGIDPVGLLEMWMWGKIITPGTKWHLGGSPHKHNTNL